MNDNEINTPFDDAVDKYANTAPPINSSANAAPAAKPDANMPPAVDYEKASYAKYVYRRVQRLRRKGKRRGIKVPYLQYALHKPDRPRIVFLVIAILSLVLFVGALVGLGFLVNELIKMSDTFTGIGDVFTALFDPELFAMTAGLSAIPGMLVFMAFLILIGLLLIPIVAVFLIYGFVREAFYMVKCSKEEFAKGNVISSRIFGLIVTLIVSTVILIVLLVKTDASLTKMLAGIVYGILVVVLGGYLAILTVEKSKNVKWFDTLDEESKQNYLAHDRALRKVKRKLRSEQQMWDDITRLGH